MKGFVLQCAMLLMAWAVFRCSCIAQSARSLTLWCRCPIIKSPPETFPPDNLLAKIRLAGRPPGRVEFLPVNCPPKGDFSAGRGAIRRLNDYVDKWRNRQIIGILMRMQMKMTIMMTDGLSGIDLNSSRLRLVIGREPTVTWLISHPTSCRLTTSPISAYIEACTVEL